MEIQNIDKIQEDQKDTPIPTYIPTSIPTSIPNVFVPIGSINAPEYYIGTIPTNLKPIYDLFGIRYVNVRMFEANNPVDYYIYEPNIAAVVSRLNLRC